MRRYLTLLLFTLLVFTQSAWADLQFVHRKDVQAFISEMVTKHHFNRRELDKIFSQVKYHEIVLKHVKSPLEANPWKTYQRLYVTETRIKNGVKFWKKHADALRKAQEIYGVPPSIIVATLGVETKYGENTGGFRVIDSLTSIGFSDSPRASYFRSELEQFLLLTREQDLNPLKVMGSYAGAIGMPQFMPRSYRYYAASFKNHKSIDLMRNTDDVIASVGNYYKENGWVQGGSIVMAATVNLDRLKKLPEPKSKSAKDWPTVTMLEKYGVKPLHRIHDRTQKAKLIELTSFDSREYWIGFHNFGVIKRYNNSDLYAMSVYLLSHYIENAKERS